MQRGFGRMNILKQLLKNQNIGNVDSFHLDLKCYGQANKDKILYFINENNINQSPYYFIFYKRE